MALFGGRRDINLFKSISRELVEDIIEQYVGYYKLILNETSSNIYGESLNKVYNQPILTPCLIDHSDQETNEGDTIGTIGRNIEVSFLIETLKELNLYPEKGDILIWRDDYYEIKDLMNNQYIFGKDNDYNYGDEYLDEFGDNYSIRVVAKLTSPDKLNINNVRI